MQLFAIIEQAYSQSDSDRLGELEQALSISKEIKNNIFFIVSLIISLFYNKYQFFLEKNAKIMYI